jgi:hypothetical protein
MSAPWKLNVTFGEYVGDDFVSMSLGAIEFETEAGCQAKWSSIPTAGAGYEDPSAVLLSRLDRLGNTVEYRPITAAAAAVLLSAPIDVLVEKARWNRIAARGDAASAATKH